MINPASPAIGRTGIIRQYPRQYSTHCPRIGVYAGAIAADVTTCSIIGNTPNSMMKPRWSQSKKLSLNSFQI